MKRDNDLLRELLIKIEQEDDWLVLVRKVIDAGAEERRREYHIELLCDAGLMLQVSNTGYRMTNAGHDYLEAVRSETLWRKTKEAVAETGGNASLEIIKKLASGFLKQKIEKHTGISLE